MTPEEEFQAIKKRVEEANRLTVAMAEAMVIPADDEPEDVK